jgi:flagellar assembly protein FliH
MGILKKGQFEEKGVYQFEKELLAQNSSVESAFTAMPPAASPHFIESVQEKAHQIITEAQQQAQDKIKAAQKEIDRLKKEAQESGFVKGEQEGLHKADEKIREALNVLNEAVKERKKIIKDAEPEILRLVVKIAEQVLRSEVTMHRDVIANIVSDAILRISDREEVLIKVNREDSDALKSSKDRLMRLIDGVKNLSIIEDLNVDPGGCIVETKLGFVDARIKTKLEAVEKALWSVYSKEEEDAN